jgi:hypothetical protein
MVAFGSDMAAFFVSARFAGFGERMEIKIRDPRGL